MTQVIVTLDGKLEARVLHGAREAHMGVAEYCTMLLEMYYVEQRAKHRATIEIIHPDPTEVL